MQQSDLISSNKKMSFIVAGILLSCVLIFDVYEFFAKTSIVAKLLVTGSFILLLFLLIPLIIHIFKDTKMNG